jgi:hypothetical protein
VTGAQFARTQAAAELEAVLARPAAVGKPAAQRPVAGTALRAAVGPLAPGTAPAGASAREGALDSEADRRRLEARVRHLGADTGNDAPPPPAARKRIGESDSQRSSGLVVSDGAGGGGVATGCVGSRSKTATAPLSDAATYALRPSELTDQGYSDVT